MKFKHLLLSAAIPASLIVAVPLSFAQTVVDADRTDPIVTSTAGTNSTPDDVTINTSVNITPASGTAITVDSDNTVILGGNVTMDDTSDVIGVDLQGGNTGDLTVAGSISMIEDFTGTDDDGDNVIDGDFAEGTGKTGILISGASPFAGNVTLATTARISVEGQNSYGIRIENTSGLTGDIDMGGVINMLGRNSRGLSLEGGVIGNVTNSGNITTRGENASAIVASGDITGQLNNSGTIANSGYRFTDRPTLAGRNLLGPEDFWQAGSAIEVNGNVTNGIFLQRVVTTTTNDDGTTTETVDGVSNINQLGSAPAILIDGQGTPIAIGIVAAITDPNDANFVEAEQYAFVNQGVLSASGIYNDFNATAFEVRDATLTGGINNTANMVASAFRSGNQEATADTAGETGLARVIVLGDGAIADRINNSGLIIAQVTEATDEVYADRTNVIAARSLQAVAIDIGANASLSEIVNSNGISAILTGRNGEAVAIRDASGTLTRIDNTGNISALGVSSDAQGLQTTSFNLIAIDVSANSTGFTLNQLVPVDSDTTDELTPADPTISGDIFLGSGDDTVNLEAGIISGALGFGDGMDAFNISGGSSYSGNLSDTDGNLTISVADNSTLINTTASPTDITSASFDATSVFRPTLDGATGEASTLNASGDITFADGATISPLLRNVIDSASTTFRILDAGGTLTVGNDLGSLGAIQSPFLYDTSFAIDPNDPNALIITLDLRSTDQLGLDTVQAAGFNSAFNALQNNTDLANAFVNITDGAEFNSSLNQLLPEFAAAARQFIVANVDGAVGAVGTHLDNARKSQAKSGGVWIQEFAYFADRDLAGLSEQYRGHGFGLSGGMDTAFGPFHSVGVNVGFATTEIEDVVGVDEPLDVVTFQLGTYAGYSSGNLGVEAYAGLGFNDFESSRKIEVGSFSGSSQGDWTGQHYNTSLRAGYDLKISDKFWARPAVSVDYLRLTEDGYTEDGPIGIALEVDKRTSELGGATAMLNFGATFQGRRTSLSPSIRMGYRNEFINSGLETNYRFAGLNTPATLIGEEFPSSAILLGFSLSAGSDFSSLGLDIDSDIRDGFIRHTGRIVLRLIF